MSEEQKLECKLVSISFTCTCSICKKIIHEPHQVSCCGAVSCRECIVSQKDGNRPCWSCDSKDYDSFPDQRFDRQTVKCPKGYKGCQWTGKFGELKEHINPEPTVEKQLEGCQFFKVCCINCHELIQRARVKDHQDKDCLKKPFTCEYCKKHKSTSEDVKKNHEAKCGQVKISCPKGCGQKILRRDTSSNAHECPEDILDCEYASVGCHEKVVRKKMQSHLKQYKHTHDSLRDRHTAQMMQGLVVKFTTELGKVRNDIQSLRSKCSPPACPINLILTDFSRCEQDYEDWHSIPFCTKPQGHTMCLKVSICQRQIGDGGYITLELRLMKGIFDDQLQWPLKSSFEVKLLRPDTEEGHHTETISFTDDTPQECSLRVEDTDRASKGVVCENFISLDRLKIAYLKDNKCCFRISTKDAM